MTTHSPTAMESQTVANNDSTAALAADLAQLNDLIANAPINEARAFVSELQQRWPESEEVAYFARVLAPPVVRGVSGEKYRARDLSAEIEWLREHATEYPGSWLALAGGQLLGSHRELKALLAEIRGIPEAESALLHFQPGSQEPR